MILNLIDLNLLLILNLWNKVVVSWFTWVKLIPTLSLEWREFITHWMLGEVVVMKMDRRTWSWTLLSKKEGEKVIHLDQFLLLVMRVLQGVLQQLSCWIWHIGPRTFFSKLWNPCYVWYEVKGSSLYNMLRVQVLVPLGSMGKFQFVPLRNLGYWWSILFFKL